MKFSGSVIKCLLVILLYTMTGCVNTGAIEAPTESPTTSQTESQTESQAESELAPLDLTSDVDIQTVASIIDRKDVFLLDVREQWEYDAGHIAGNTLIPMGSIPSRLADIPKDQTVIIYCHSGARSQQVTNFLNDQGYTNVHNMLGGITAWQSAGFQIAK